ncbi:acyl-CoA thioesterase [Chitinimonas sp.]|uniref:acyl-CoA thioesterase n=1 Tax=Chitinimonas sp. TaxID=1934313 RepID=UPI0035B07155
MNTPPPLASPTFSPLPTKESPGPFVTSIDDSLLPPETRISKTVTTFHCDAFGHVNNARYLEFLDEARQTIVDLSWFLERGLGIVVSRIDIQYLRPAKLGDRLVIDTELVSISEKEFVLRQVVTRGVKQVATADVSCACVNQQGRRVAIDEVVKQNITAMLGHTNDQQSAAQASSSLPLKDINWGAPKCAERLYILRRLEEIGIQVDVNLPMQDLLDCLKRLGLGANFDIRGLRECRNELIVAGILHPDDSNNAFIDWIRKSDTAHVSAQD